jgi:peptidoglycan/LPS O-acetylase OafA/YrhL
MGRISYGYYLIHVPLLLLFIHYGSARVPNVVIAAAVIATTIGIAWLLNIWVEKPAIELGRRLADKLDRRLLPQPPMGQKASVVQTQASASDRSNP